MSNPSSTVRRGDGESGASLLELAVVIPVLLLAVLGAADFGRAYYDRLVITNAARAGAQFGAHSPENAANQGGIISAVNTDLDNTIGSQNATVVAERYCNCTDGSNVDCDGGACSPGAGTKRTYVRVEVQHTFQTLFNYPGIPYQIPLTEEVRMRAR